jgi:hypothetical protein
MIFVKKFLIAFILGGVFVSGLIFSSDNPYSINKNQQSLGETRNFSELIFSSNRIELKDRLELTIFNSELRNTVLKNIASFTWMFQKKSNSLDYQFFNTEIYFGTYGEVFPKYSNCKHYDYQNLQIKPDGEVEFIFLILPMKQEIETNRIHSHQKQYSICNNSKNLINFINTYRDKKVHIIDTYFLFSNKNERFYEFGDTHWSDLGVKTLLAKLLEISHNQDNIPLIKKGSKDENNLILSRLGLIEITSLQHNYEIEFETDDLKSLLIIHDSFFEETFVSKNLLNNFYIVDYMPWQSIQTISSEDSKSFFKQYDYVIFESSIDSFFEERVLLFSN